MIKTILIQIALHAGVLLIAGLVHEWGHRFSLVMSKWEFTKKPFKTIIKHYELLTHSCKMHMYWFGILWGAVVIFTFNTITPVAPALYLIGCHSDFKEILKLLKETDK